MRITEQHERDGVQHSNEIKHLQNFVVDVDSVGAVDALDVDQVREFEQIDKILQKRQNQHEHRRQRRRHRKQTHETERNHTLVVVVDQRFVVRQQNLVGD